MAEPPAQYRCIGQAMHKHREDVFYSAVLQTDIMEVVKMKVQEEFHLLTASFEFHIWPYDVFSVHVTAVKKRAIITYSLLGSLSFVNFFGNNCRAGTTATNHFAGDSISNATEMQLLQTYFLWAWH